MGPEDPTVKARRVWDAYARRYDRDMRLVEWLFADGRQWVCSRSEGDVLEVGVGSGRNFGHYPAGIRLTGVDLSPAMLAIARDRSGDLNLRVDLREADAQALPFDDASFDSVVCTLSLCAIPDERAAVREMWRVLRPGGRLLLLDHVVSSWWLVRVGQRIVERFTIRAAGEHLTRRPRHPVEAMGFQVAEAQRLRAGLVERLAAIKA